MGGPRRNWRYWKSVERQAACYFPGASRTPLSGSNSKMTSADLIRTPRWIYVEVKRDLRYTRVWESLIDAIGGHFYRGVAAMVFNDVFAFHLDSFYLLKDASFENTFSWRLADRSCLRRLFVATSRLAEREGKEATIVLFRVHGRKGFFALINADQAGPFERWLRKTGRAAYRQFRDAAAKTVAAHAKDQRVSSASSSS